MEDAFLYTIGPLVGGLILYAIIAAVTRAPGAVLQQKFVSLGTLSGKTRGQICGVVGPPNSVSAQGNGKTLLQWMATGYHIALLFDANDVCEGVTHESRV